jgi:hypothetical protein
MAFEMRMHNRLVKIKAVSPKMCRYFLIIMALNGILHRLINRLTELAMRRVSVTVTIALTVVFAAGSAEAKLDLYVDKSSQRMSVVQDGSLLYVWPVSTGRDSFATPSGIYTPERLERSWFSKAYYNTPMPYAIFFHNGYAIHGSYDIARLGGPASHGCIRLHPQNAAMLFSIVEQEGPSNTTIVVGGDGPPNPQAPRYRDLEQFRSAYSGDGEIRRGSYPPSPRTTPYSQTPYPQMSPYSQTSPYSQMPYSQMSPYPQMSQYPQTSPYYDAERYVDAPYRRRGDNDQFATRGADPAIRFRALRRDAEASIEPNASLRDGNRPPMRSFDPPIIRPPAPRRDVEASIDPNAGLRYGSRLPMRSFDPPIIRPPAPRRGVEASIEPNAGPRGGNRLPTRSFDPTTFRPLAPRRDVEASIEANAGPRGSDRVPLRSVDPMILRPAAPRRDAAVSIEAKISPRGSDRVPMRNADPAPRPPAPRRDADASIEPTISLRGGNRPSTTNKSSSKCPACSSNGEPSESANRQEKPSETTKPPPPAPPPASPPSSPPSSEQQQPSPGYKILPKSYWAGASWRWRFKSDQEVH